MLYIIFRALNYFLFDLLGLLLIIQISTFTFSPFLSVVIFHSSWFYLIHSPTKYLCRLLLRYCFVVVFYGHISLGSGRADRFECVNNAAEIRTCLLHSQNTPLVQLTFELVGLKHNWILESSQMRFLLRCRSKSSICSMRSRPHLLPFRPRKLHNGQDFHFPSLTFHIRLDTLAIMVQQQNWFIGLAFLAM